MIGPGAVLKYDKGEYSVVSGESIFDLYKTLPIDSQYCKKEDVYYTPKGKLTKNQLDVLNGKDTETTKEEGFFKKIYNKLKEFMKKY